MIQERESEVVVFVARRGRSEVLVLRRCSALGGFWHVVAGGVEPGEGADEAARRETMEEAGLAIDQHRVSCRVRFSYAVPEPYVVDAVGVRRAPEMTVDCVLVDAPDGFEPTLNTEHVEYAWCTVDEAVRRLYWENVRDALLTLVRAPARSVVARA